MARLLLACRDARYSQLFQTMALLEAHCTIVQCEGPIVEALKEEGARLNATPPSALFIVSDRVVRTDGRTTATFDRLR